MANWREISIVKFYLQLAHVGIDHNTPITLRKYILLGNSINLTTLTLIIPFTFLFYYLGIQKLGILLGSFFFLFSFYHYLTYKGLHFLSRSLVVISLNVILGAYGILLGKESGIQLLYLVFFTLPFLLFSVRDYLFIALCCLSSVLPFCLIWFQVIDPVVSLDLRTSAILSNAMLATTFGWMLLNNLYIIRANFSIENTLKESNRLLQLRNRDLEQFAYVASHDLQEPLRTVASYVELLETKYAGAFDSNGKQYMKYVVQSTHRLKKLIKDLLDYSRIGRNFTSQTLNTELLLKEVLQDLAHLINENEATITYNNLPEIKGSATDIKLLFQNLISNAIKFKSDSSKPLIQIEGSVTNNARNFSVTDNGIGIEPNYRERIFIIFQRLHNIGQYDGNGIGLAHCKKIVELHEGKIWVESEFGKGSTFHFSIPL